MTEAELRRMVKQVRRSYTTTLWGAVSDLDQKEWVSRGMVFPEPFVGVQPGYFWKMFPVSIGKWEAAIVLFMKEGETNHIVFLFLDGKLVGSYLERRWWAWSASHMRGMRKYMRLYSEQGCQIAQFQKDLDTYVSYPNSI